MELIMTIMVNTESNLTDQFTMVLDGLLTETPGVSHVERSDYTHARFDHIERKIYGEMSPLKRRDLKNEIISIGKEFDVSILTYDININPSQKYKFGAQNN